MTHVGTHEADVSLTTHRRRLRQHEDAWQRFEYKTKCTLQPVSAIRVVNGVYGSVREDRIHFARLSSVSDPDHINSWSHPVDDGGWLDFTFCPEQDLFIVMTLASDE
jgi:hypothetical protein